MKHFRNWALTGITLALLFVATAGAPQKTKQQAKISKEDAQKTALKEAPGQVKDSELEEEDGHLIYSFDIQTDTGIKEVHVDAMTGKVIKVETETKQHEAQEKAMDARDKPRISKDEARKIALKRVPGKIEEEDLEHENGKLVYAFEIATKSGSKYVHVDAATGQVMKVADEDKEEDHEPAKPEHPRKPPVG